MSLSLFRHASQPIWFYDDLLDDMWYRPLKTKDKNNKPYYEVKENEKDYIVEVHVPGFKKEEIKIELRDGVLLLEAKQEDENSKKLYKHSWSVDKNLTQEDIKASLNEGLLSLTINKKADKEPQKYSISIQ